MPVVTRLRRKPDNTTTLQIFVSNNSEVSADNSGDWLDLPDTVVLLAEREFDVGNRRLQHRLTISAVEIGDAIDTPASPMQKIAAPEPEALPPEGPITELLVRDEGFAMAVNHDTPQVLTTEPNETDPNPSPPP